MVLTCSLCSRTGHPRLSYYLSVYSIQTVCFSFPLWWETMLYLQASQQLSGFAWTLSLPILWRHCAKWCFVSWWETNEFIPGGLTSDSQFVNSLLSSQGEKPSPDIAGKTGSQSVGKWVLIHWATVSGSYPKLLAFIRRLQIWRITSNWKLMHNSFKKGSP